MNSTTLTTGATNNELPAAMIRQLREMHCSDVDIILCCRDIINHLADDVGEAYEDSRGTEDEQAAYNEINNLCMDLLETTRTYLTILCQEGMEDAPPSGATDPARHS
jgi:hypothetical protein